MPRKNKRPKKKYKSRSVRKIKSLELNFFLRNLPELEIWRADSLLKYNGKCAITNTFRKGQIHIHHSKAHHTIRDEVLSDLGMVFYSYLCYYNEQERLLIAALYIEKHKNIEGIPILRRVHKLFHKLYGMNATVEEFDEFKQRWNKGEFVGLNIISRPKTSTEMC
jgi:hypothetical protein